MPDSYRITVRGAMSERFCRGFAGLTGRSQGDRTVLEAVPPAGARLDDVLSRLENLGLEVIAVEPVHGSAHDRQEH